MIKRTLQEIADFFDCYISIEGQFAGEDPPAESADIWLSDKKPLVTHMCRDYKNYKNDNDCGRRGCIVDCNPLGGGCDPVETPRTCYQLEFPEGTNTLLIVSMNDYLTDEVNAIQDTSITIEPHTEASYE